MTETKITITPGDMVASQYSGTAWGGSGNTMILTGATNANATATPAEFGVSSDLDTHIRRIVVEEVAKAEGRIAEMVLRKLNDQIRLQAGMQG